MASGWGNKQAHKRERERERERNLSPKILYEAAIIREVALSFQQKPYFFVNKKMAQEFCYRHFRFKP